MKKENQRVVVTKKMLKDALLCLLQDKTIDKVNVTELCRNAQVNRATFYAHYGTVQDVLDEMERDLSQTLLARQLEQPQRTMTTDIDVLCSCLYENHALLRILFRNCSAQAFKKMMNVFCEDILFHTSAAQNEDTDTLRLSATFLAGGVFFMLNAWILEEIPKKPEEIRALIFSMLSDRMLTL